MKWELNEVNNVFDMDEDLFFIEADEMQRLNNNQRLDMLCRGSQALQLSIPSGRWACSAGLPLLCGRALFLAR